MSNFSEYASIVIKSLLQLREGDALSINTEECDFEFAKVIADMAVRTTKVVSKIVVTVDGKPSEVVDFDPYEQPVEPRALCMLHLQHVDKQQDMSEQTLDVIVDKEDLKAVQKLGHLADPIILDRRIAIPWCVIPAFYANNPQLDELVNKLSIDIDGQVLATKYRKKYLNNIDLDCLHFFSDNCDFTLSIPKGSMFVGGPDILSNGREFLSSTNFQRLICNVEKNSLDGWFNAKAKVLGKEYDVKFEFKDGKLVSNIVNPQIKSLLLFDENLSKPGYVVLNDKDFSIVFGCSSVESLVEKPESLENLPSFFNDSIYKFECKLDEKLNIEYSGSDFKDHELVRKGFFLQ